jgi:anti-sigma factor RsiW
MSDDRHQELRLLVQADCDGELAPREAAAVAAHLDDCAECRTLQRDLRATKAAVRDQAPRYQAPDDFRRRMAAMMAADAPRPRAAKPRWRWGGWLGSFGFGAAVAAALILLIVMPRNDTGIEQSVLDGHLRALQSDRLYDVASTDQHTVKPWFAGKLDFTPPVKDLAAQGFPLKGGRIDTVHGRTVAAMVYGRAKHAIDLYVWSRPDIGDAPPRDVTRSGYNLVTWSRGDMIFWAVSDLNRAELDDFVRDWQTAP